MARSVDVFPDPMLIPANAAIPPNSPAKADSRPPSSVETGASVISARYTGGSQNAIPAPMQIERKVKTKMSHLYETSTQHKTNKQTTTKTDKTRNNKKNNTRTEIGPFGAPSCSVMKVPG